MLVTLFASRIFYNYVIYRYPVINGKFARNARNVCKHKRNLATLARRGICNNIFSYFIIFTRRRSILICIRFCSMISRRRRILVLDIKFKQLLQCTTRRKHHRADKYKRPYSYVKLYFFSHNLTPSLQYINIIIILL